MTWRAIYARPWLSVAAVISELGAAAANAAAAGVPVERSKFATLPEVVRPCQISAATSSTRVWNRRFFIEMAPFVASMCHSSLPCHQPPFENFASRFEWYPMTWLAISARPIARHVVATHFDVATAMSARLYLKVGVPGGAKLGASAGASEDVATELAATASAATAAASKRAAATLGVTAGASAASKRATAGLSGAASGWAAAAGAGASEGAVGGLGDDLPASAADSEEVAAAAFSAAAATAAAATAAEATAAISKTVTAGPSVATPGWTAAAGAGTSETAPAASTSAGASEGPTAGLGGDLPATFSWTDPPAGYGKVIGAVHDQQDVCASCWAFVTADSIGGRWAVINKGKDLEVGTHG